MSLRWDLCSLADQIEAIVKRAEADLRLEQAVYGLDAKDELQLQEMLTAGLGVHYSVAQVHYPSSAGNKLTHRRRCDIVLTPPSRPLRLDSALPTLFDPPDLCSGDEALWLEVKIAYQFREGGIRHGGYGAQWRNAVVDDLRKMEEESMIKEAGLLLGRVQRRAGDSGKGSSICLSRC